MCQMSSHHYLATPLAHVVAIESTLGDYAATNPEQNMERTNLNCTHYRVDLNLSIIINISTRQNHPKYDPTFSPS
jgi:hypothetical protein